MTDADEMTIGTIASAADVRRVVTGLDADGKSCVLFDGPAPWPGALGPTTVVNLWAAPALPADNSGTSDVAAQGFDPAQLGGPGYGFMLLEIAPGSGSQDPGMHFTNTNDHLVLLAGELTLVLDRSDVVLRAGDTMICRGHVHGWRNDGAVPAVGVSLHLPARQSSPGTAAF
jgi:quercetin dioxygenase-like cupin family protein